jgi:hypothetical protein
LLRRTKFCEILNLGKSPTVKIVNGNLWEILWETISARICSENGGDRRVGIDLGYGGAPKFVGEKRFRDNAQTHRD